MGKNKNGNIADISELTFVDCLNSDNTVIAIADFNDEIIEAEYRILYRDELDTGRASDSVNVNTWKNHDNIVATLTNTGNEEYTDVLVMVYLRDEKNKIIDIKLDLVTLVSYYMKKEINKDDEESKKMVFKPGETWVSQVITEEDYKNFDFYVITTHDEITDDLDIDK